MELWVASWRATYADIDFDARLEWFKARLAALEADGALTLCLYEDAPSALAGFVVIHPETGWLDQLCVHPNCFGAGAARPLIEAARQAAPDGIRLDVNVDNARARAFTSAMASPSLAMEPSVAQVEPQSCWNGVRTVRADGK